MQGGLIILALFVCILVASLLLTVLAIADFVTTLRKRAALYAALGAAGEQGSALLWSIAYAVSVLGVSMLLMLLFVFSASPSY